MSRKFSVALSLALAAGSLSAHAQSELTDKQKFSYSVGFQVGQQLHQRMQSASDLDLDASAFAQAIEAVFAGEDPALSIEEMQAILQADQSRRQEEQAAMAEKNQQRGDAFRTANKEKDGVVETNTGLQYREITAGSGRKPTVDDTVVVHYHGTFVDGNVFDSSYDRGEPATFTVGGIIKGWQEVLPLMSEGAKWNVVIPADLAYGQNGAGRIGPNETLVFDIELIEIK